MAEQSQRTEYTLQGVMRFLQVEWHAHERARNSWDIERAEMKNKIAKQEGDSRSSKKLNESLDKQIRMLEKVLKNERAKNKAIAAGESYPTEEDLKNQMNGRPSVDKLLKGMQKIQLEDAGDGDGEDGEKDADGNRRPRGFLQKCVEELTYLLTPPTYPPPPPRTGHPFNGESYGQAEWDDRYQQRPPAKRISSNLPSLANQYPPPPPAPTRPFQEYQPSGPQHNQSFQSQPMARQGPYQPHSHDSSRGPVEEVPRSVAAAPPQYLEEPVDRTSHLTEVNGRVASSQEEEVPSLTSDDSEGWNFEVDIDTIEPPQPRRPDTDHFPTATTAVSKSSPRMSPSSHRRKSSGSASMSRKRSDGGHDSRDLTRNDSSSFHLSFVMKSHLDVIRSVIFTGGGSPSEPEVCSAGDDGLIKRWIIPSGYAPGKTELTVDDLDVRSYFTHRGHEGKVTSLAACSSSSSFSTGGRAIHDGWIFSGGEDATVRVWERGRVDPKATLDGHTDAVWTLCILPTPMNSMYGPDNGGQMGDRIYLASGSADQTIKIWAVSTPPQMGSPQTNMPRRGSRRHSVTAGSGFPSSPQPSTASMTPFHYTLLHTIEFPRTVPASPTCIAPLGSFGENFVVSYTDSSVLVFDVRTGEEVVGMASSETYDGTPATGVNSVVASSTSTDMASQSQNAEGTRGGTASEEEGMVHGPTGSHKSGGVEGVIISGHEDRYVRFYDANSGQCTYSMLAHPAAIAAMSLSPDTRELVTTGHDASIRIWSLEKRSCTQEIMSHRKMRGEGIPTVVWAPNGKFICTGGGDGLIKVWARQ